MSESKPKRKAATKKRGDVPIVDNVMTRIRVRHASLGPSTRSIADFILENPRQVVGMSVTELAEATGASDGSVINLCRQLDLSGFQQLKLSLAQEVVQPVQFIHEDLRPSDTTPTVCRKTFHAGIQALRDTLSILDADAVDEAVRIIRAADRVEIYGIGSSAPIAEDAQYRMLRIGIDAKVVVDSHIQAISASRTGPKVAVLTISHSGATHETLAATRLAKEAGAKTIIVTNFSSSPLQAYADVKLFTMARETKFRTEAMTSRIAQLCVLDALIAALALADYDRATDTLRKTFDVLSLKRF
ncbi:MULTISPECIES: MurR/RpiR family transcriptional regulator [unclassified Hyphomonas]|jgi:DNA-binding MurR/RpiR family transcriptional regulator|uniref:MurR/RpiR family transcriptional regulator n=1 Tax=unclassified Hyphomonas TaxID=2630699 RepID=UPI000458B094|nr:MULTISPECIES: MurR/RpiR family transcriptional regulator [unclassified Hyphomonas]KCZ46531.1 transcriptional regulator [Hyphomonas sp. CY54-11-8]RAN40277.1 transcriptional regulator [Hyphomonas sp. GM-8P]